MLVNFTVKNYRSFKYERTFSMEACSIKEHKEYVINEGKYNILPLTVFYGANSGGKSNLIQAISTMRSMVRHSVRLNEGDTLPYDPFALDENSNSLPTLFEVQFIKDNALYGLVIGERNFHKNTMESEGTKKVIEMSGPIFDTLNEGKTLIVDELDAKLHPILTRNIVLLFMDPDKNRHGAQLD